MNESLFQRGEKVLLACSGGKDSVYLLERLFREGKRLGIELGVAHIDHGLRPESHEDARFVRELAATRGLHYFERRLELAHTRAPQGIEALAREKRYEALEEIALAEGFASVATAHHRDDQIETVLLRILQGARPRHWRGIHSNRPLRKSSTIRLIRPLLETNRREIESAVLSWHLFWQEDATNRDARFLRNRLRRFLASLPRCRHDELAEQVLVLQRLAATLESLESRFRTQLLQGRLRVWESAIVINLGTSPKLPHWFLSPLLEDLLHRLDAAAPKGTIDAAVRLWQEGRSGALVVDPRGVTIRRRGLHLEFLRHSTATAAT